MPIEENKHPRSLKIFFATEMWERYGFYVIQTLIVIFMIERFNWEDQKVYPLIGAFTALTYLSPMIGGWIADRMLGQKRSILLGAAILFFSYLSMTFFQTENSLLLSLACIAVGTGLLKPNISSLLGNEYPLGSPKRERGFTIFYLGITSGIILGTTLPSYIQSIYGWPAAFFSATIGIFIGILTFSYGIYRFRISDYEPYKFSVKNIISVIGLLLALGYGAFFILQQAALADALFSIIGIAAVVYLIKTIREEDGFQAQETMVIGLLCLISVLFWSFYFQMFSSMMLLLKRLALPTLFGMSFPPPYYVAVQSIGMIVFGVFFAHNKKQLTKKQGIIRVGNKFLLSMLFMCLSYTLITLVCHFNNQANLLSPLYFIPSYLFISLAELLLSPVGLSAITILSSTQKVSTMMGIFFVSLGMGGFLSGKLATLTAIPKIELDAMSLIALKSHYATSFRHLLIILFASTFVCVVINLLIRTLMTEPPKKLTR